MEQHEPTTLDTRVVEEILRQPAESEWLEFKSNLRDPDEIGQYISALANSAARLGKRRAWLVWGVEDRTKQLVGTTFSFTAATVGKGSEHREHLEPWLRRLLEPDIEFRAHSLNWEGKPLCFLEIFPARNYPVSFKRERYIRIGSYKKKLAEYPEIEASLWSVLRQTHWEEDIARDHCDMDELSRMLNISAYFHHQGLPLPAREEILHRLVQEKFLVANGGTLFGITNLGAILYGFDVRKFEGLLRRGLRVIVYRGTDRQTTLHDEEFTEGYALGFDHAYRYLWGQLPRQEVIRGPFREEQTEYSAVILRELLANALIHQDFTLRGMGPTFEIFSNRVEITNPGRPLVETERFLDTAPVSRNEYLANYLRRIRIGEAKGSGIDTVVQESEREHLPPTTFMATDLYTRVVVPAKRHFSEMSPDERLLACRQHAALTYVQGRKMTNATFRNRFDLTEGEQGKVSRILREALRRKYIKRADQDGSARKYVEYLPYWA